MNSFRRRFGLIGLAFLVAWGVAFGQDEESTVTLENGISIRGAILRYDDRGVTLQFGNGSIKSYPMSDIAEVRVGKLGSGFIDGEEAYLKGDYAEAEKKLLAVLATEDRPWVKERVRPLLIKTYVALGKVGDAAELFGPLAEERDDMDLMAFAPLFWRPGTWRSVELTDLTRRGAVRDSGLERLISASWALEHPEPRTALAARRVLQELAATGGEERVRLFAKLQLSRVAPVRLGEMNSLTEAVAGRAASAAAGPFYLLARRLEGEGGNADAALVYLRAVAARPVDPGLAADSLYSAARASRAAGLDKDAERITAQLRERFPKFLQTPD